MLASLKSYTISTLAANNRIAAAAPLCDMHPTQSLLFNGMQYIVGTFTRVLCRCFSVEGRPY